MKHGQRKLPPEDDVSPSELDAAASAPATTASPTPDPADDDLFDDDDEEGDDDEEDERDFFSTLSRTCACADVVHATTNAKGSPTRRKAVSREQPPCRI